MQINHGTAQLRPNPLFSVVPPEIDTQYPEIQQNVHLRWFLLGHSVRLRPVYVGGNSDKEMRCNLDELPPFLKPPHLSGFKEVINL